MPRQQTSNRTVILLILGLLSAVGPFSIDMYLPAFQTIANDFDISVDQVQLSLTSFFIGIAFGQLIYGPLLDKYGRKKPLLVGLLIYIVATLLCIMTRDIEHLIALRFLQALGSCAGMVASRAMIQDYYEPREAARVFSLLMLVIAISPILAPSAGALLLNHLDWHYIFVSLLVIGAIIFLATYFYLPESYRGSADFSLRPKAIVGKFWEVLTNKTFLVYCLVGSIASSGLYAYLAGSSFVMQQHYGLSQTEYGLAFAFVASAMIFATQVNRALLKKWSSPQISKIANIWQSLIALLMFIGLLTDTLNFPILLGLIFCYLLGHGFIFPNTSAMALSPFKALAGSASALLGCVQMAIGALTSGLVSFFHNGTIYPMVIVMGAAALLSLFIHFFSGKSSDHTAF
ncbi:multidrug effflux MFS transporter [Sphingobacterium paludis]|uniref:DHA1 family bicyclomycin/chloramphenicol resistance-like MFS transporter n=1 Tax=Sphingobacterium paludis TaxID=1476465 RepID=A0A4R7D7M5_9SPHI|nr:multidrug effflux MFS transporter [Sphingobacterium paludis]TDS17193.1 DHA1 family bicyclomycin/chloramphenicol resistance-like MFS transporter [Sphingobacterium paludis]